MACTIRYTKVGETQEVKYTEAEFVALLAEGELDALRKSGKIDLSDVKDFVKEISVKDNNAAKNMGFDSAEKAIKQINNATGNNYMEWGEIPPAEKGLVSDVLSALNQKADKETAIAAASKYIANLVEEGKLEEDYANDLLNTVSSNFSPKFEKKGSLAANFLLAEKAKEAQMKDKKIVMTELKALKKQMEDWYKGFKEGVRTGKINEKNYQKELSAIKAEWLKAIAGNKEIGKTGRKKLAAIARAFDNATSDKAGMRKGIPTKSKMEKLFEYLNKFANDAQYETKVNEAKKLAKNVNKNTYISTFGGRVKQFTNIDIKSLGALIGDYKQALEDINKKAPDFTLFNQIFDEVIEKGTKSKEDKEWDEIDNIEKLEEKWAAIKKVKINSVEDYLEFLKNKKKTQSILDAFEENTRAGEKSIFDKLSKELREPDSKLNENIQKQVNALRAKLSEDISTMLENTDTTDVREGQEEEIINLARYNKDMLNKYLSLEELNDLYNAIENFNDTGYFDIKTLNNIRAKLELERNFEGITLTRGDKTQKYYEGELMKETLNAIDSALRNKSSGGKFYNAFTSKIFKMFEEARKNRDAAGNDLAKASVKLGSNNKERNLSSHKLGTIFRYLDTKFGGNFDWLGILLGNEKAISQLNEDNIEEFIGGTNAKIFKEIKGATFRERLDKYLERERAEQFDIGYKGFVKGSLSEKRYQEIYDNLLAVAGENGVVSKEKVKELMTTNREKLFNKNEIEFLNQIEKTLEKLSSKALDASEIRGKTMELLENYMFRDRLGRTAGDVDFNASFGQQNVKKVSDQTKERENEGFGAIETNIEKLLDNVIRQITRDNALQKQNEYFRLFFEKAKSEFGVNLASALRYRYISALEREFSNVDNFLLRRIKQAAQGSLYATTAKGVAEVFVAPLTSIFRSGKPIAVSLRLLKTIIGQAEPTKKIAAALGHEIDLNNIISEKFGIHDMKFKTRGNYEKFTNIIAKTLVGATESIAVKMVFVPSLSDKFQELTGEKLNLKKLLANDKAYIDKNYFELQEALSYAKWNTYEIVGSPFQGGDKLELSFNEPFTGKKSPEISGKKGKSTNFVFELATLMQKFPMRAYSTLKSSVRGQYGLQEGAIRSAGVLAEAAVYKISFDAGAIALKYFLALAASAVVGAAGDDEDKKMYEERAKLAKEELDEFNDNALNHPYAIVASSVLSPVFSALGTVSNIVQGGILGILISQVASKYDNATTKEDRDYYKELLKSLELYGNNNNIFATKKAIASSLDERGKTPAALTIIKEQVARATGIVGYVENITNPFNKSELGDEKSPQATIRNFYENATNEEISMATKVALGIGASIDAFNVGAAIIGVNQLPFKKDIKTGLNQFILNETKNYIPSEKDYNPISEALTISLKPSNIATILDETYGLTTKEIKNISEPKMEKISKIVSDNVYNFIEKNPEIQNIISNEKKRSIIKGLAKDFYDEAIEIVLPNLEPTENLRLTEEEIKARQLSKEEKAKYPSHVERDYAREINKTINKQNYLGITPDEKKYINIFSKMSLTEKGKMIKKLNDKDRILAFIRLKQVGALGEEEDIRNLKKIIDLKDLEIGDNEIKEFRLK